MLRGKVEFSHPPKLRARGYLTSVSEVVSSWSAVSKLGSANFCSVSSHGSRILSTPVEVLPTDVFLLWQNSEKLDDREWHVLYPVESETATEEESKRDREIETERESQRESRWL